MANARETKKRIRTVKNTAKITRTMEMVATAKSRKTYSRIAALAPYADKIRELLSDLSAAGEASHPLLRREEKPRHVTLLVITANRGLCGSFNGNILDRCEKRLKALKEAGIAHRLVVVGRKGVGYFKFARVQVDEAHTDLDEKVPYERTESIAASLMDEFVAGRTDSVEVFSNRVRGSAAVLPDTRTLLPLELAKGAKQGADYIYSPTPAELLRDLVPLAFKTMVFRAIIESMAAEQIARRVAMKNAADSAKDMVKDLTRLYNRTRQAAITREIAEIVGGAEALK